MFMAYSRLGGRVRNGRGCHEPAAGFHGGSNGGNGDNRDTGSSVVIGIAGSAVDRARLARLLGRSEAFLIVSNASQARAFLGLTAIPATEPDAVALTRLELDLLTCLNTQPLRTWTYADLHRTVWRSAAGDRTGDVQSLVKRLRRKLDRLGTSVTVDAVRGTGFRLSDHQRPTIT